MRAEGAVEGPDRVAVVVPGQPAGHWRRIEDIAPGIRPPRPAARTAGNSSSSPGSSPNRRSTRPARSTPCGVRAGEHGGALAAALGQAELRAGAGLNDLAVHSDAPAGDVDPIGGEHHVLTQRSPQRSPEYGDEEGSRVAATCRRRAAASAWTAAAVPMSASSTSGPVRGLAPPPPGGPSHPAQHVLAGPADNPRPGQRRPARAAPAQVLDQHRWRPRSSLMDWPSCSFRGVGLLALDGD